METVKNIFVIVNGKGIKWFDDGQLIKKEKE